MHIYPSRYFQDLEFSVSLNFRGECGDNSLYNYISYEICEYSMIFAYYDENKSI